MESGNSSNTDRLRGLRQGVQQRLNRLRGDATDNPSVVVPHAAAPSFIAAKTDSEQPGFAPEDPRSDCVYERCDLHGPGSAIQVSLEILQHPCCAHLTAGVPILRNLQIRMGAGVKLRQPLIRLSVQPREVCGEWHSTPGSLSSGGAVLVRQIPLPFRAELFAARSGFVNLSVQAAVEDSGVTLFAATRSLRLFPAHTIPLTAGRHGDSCWMSAVSVRPDSPALLPLVKTSGDALQQLVGKASLEGYLPLQKQLGSSAPKIGLDVKPIVDYVRAVCLALNQHLSGYVTSPPEVQPEWQRIRTAEELHISRHGNCLDYSVLTASLLEAIGLDPFVVLLPEHAIAGCSLVPLQWLGDPQLATLPLLTTVANQASLQKFCQPPFLFLECTALPTVGDLDKLVASGLQSLQVGLAKSVELAHRVQPVTVISIRAARRLGIQPIP
jgi:hypothetical protein